MKRILAMLLALCLIFGQLPAAVIAEETPREPAPADIPGEAVEAPEQTAEPERETIPEKEVVEVAPPVLNTGEIDSYPIIEADTETTVEITTGGEYAYFRFTPAYTESYTFRSLSNTDTYGYLYDSDMNELDRNDDDGQTTNFAITYTLEAGKTYVLAARFYNGGSTGSFPVILKTNHEVEGVVTVSPTCTTDGEIEYTCSVCGLVYTEVIPASHTPNEKNVCTVCGEICVPHGTCGENLTWTLVDGVLTIRGEGEMCYLGGSGSAPWDYVREQIVTVVVHEGVTKLSSQAFYGCTNLVDIQLPKSLLVLETATIMECDRLSQITLPENVSTIECNPIVACDAFTDYFVADGNSSFSAVDGVLFDKNITKLIAYPSGKTAQQYAVPDTVTSIDQEAFSFTNHLVEVSIPDSVIEILNGAFYSCDALSTVLLGEQVSSIANDAFRCTFNLENIIVDENNETYASRDGVLFSKDGTSLILYPIGKNDATYSIPMGTESIADYAFECSSLRSIDLPETIRAVGFGAFSHCQQLQRIIIPANVEIIDAGAFAYSDQLAQIIFRGDAPQIGETTFLGITATCYYPADNASWDAVITQSFVDDALEWISYDTSGHLEETISGKAATCTEDGLTDGKLCMICGTVTVAQETIPATGHSYVDGVCQDCGEISDDGESGEGSGSGSGEGSGGDSGGSGSGNIWDESDVTEDNLTWTFKNGVLTISGEGPMKDYNLLETPWEPHRYQITSVVIEPGVTSIGTYAFSNCINLENVTLPDSIKQIKAFAFDCAVNLEAVKLPENLLYIGYGAFSACEVLDEINLPNSLQVIDAYAFNQTAISQIKIPASLCQLGGCAFGSTLTEITIDERNPYFILREGVLFTQDMTTLVCYPSGRIGTDYTIPDGVTTISNGAFYHATNLVRVSIPDTATNWGSDIFTYCTSLETVNIPYGVNSLSRSVFDNCSNLKSISIPDSVTSIGLCAFYEASSLTDLVIPQSVTTIGIQAFQGCDGLTELILPKALLSIGHHAFSECLNLETVVFPDGLASISDGAFLACKSLQTVFIPASVTSIGNNIFRLCTNLTEINVDAANPNYDSIDGVLFDEDGYTLIQYPAGKNVKGSYSIPDGTVCIGAYALSESQLSNIEIPNTMTEISNYTFYGCGDLREIIIPFGVVSIGNYAFSYADSLEQIIFEGDAPEFGPYFLDHVTATAYYPADNPTWTEDVLQNYGGTITWVPYTTTTEVAFGWSGNTTWVLTDDGVLTFSGSGNMRNYGFDGGQPWLSYANQITAVVIEEGVTSVGSGAFMNLTKLESVTLPESGLTKIGEAAFYGCTSLKEVYIPDGIYTVWAYTFKNCSALESVRLPKTLIKIDQGAFENCTSLDFIFIPGNTDIIGSWSFKGCTGLKEADMQWADATEIREGAFKNCSALTKIILPADIQTLGDSCFYGIGAESFTVPETVTSVEAWCFARAALTEITFKGDAPEIGEGAFNKITLTAHYPGDNFTWTSDVMQNYGGTVTWKAN